jgi:hypothetical protein
LKTMSAAWPPEGPSRSRVVAQMPAIDRLIGPSRYA